MNNSSWPSSARAGKTLEELLEELRTSEPAGRIQVLQAVAPLLENASVELQRRFVHWVSTVAVSGKHPDTSGEERLCLSQIPCAYRSEGFVQHLIWHLPASVLPERILSLPLEESCLLLEGWVSQFGSMHLDLHLEALRRQDGEEAWKQRQARLLGSSQAALRLAVLRSSALAAPPAPALGSESPSAAGSRLPRRG